ncbi:hypothetical protein SS50377_28282 [Spironucleus salmonicida]|uniref:Uncharacterized protein n=1 Tax=Spironucleus salmonicida TaxID=348837 RepID=V6LV05_9EUKA|nr:hypothetical protein SS50377_28282 [Spironucleus salmonicida]|eukprot:EST48462.1 Hypothetical protein SS50377_11411 [Spironucleus salmonicida]
MKFITLQQFKQTYITPKTKFALLINKNILPILCNCQQCTQPLKYLLSNAFPEKICYYCGQCNAKFNLKFRSIYNTSELSLKQIILLAEDDLNERLMNEYLKFPTQKLEIRFPIPLQLKEKEKNLLNEPKYTPTAIQYVDQTEKIQQQKEIELERRLDLMKTQKLQAGGLKFKRAPRVVEKIGKMPNEKHQKHIIRIPQIEQDSERIKYKINDVPGPGQYEYFKQQRPQSMKINRQEKEQKTIVNNQAPYYIENEGIGIQSLYKVPVINNSPNRQDIRPDNKLGPWSYSPRRKIIQKNYDSIKFNQHERFVDKGFVENDMVSPAYYGVDWDKEKKIRFQNPRAVVNSYDRYLHSQNIDSLIKNFIQ